MAGTATRTRSKAGAVAGAGATAPRIDGRMRFNWMEQYRAIIAYEGETCVITANRKNFRGQTLTAAVNLGIAALPMRGKS